MRQLRISKSITSRESQSLEKYLTEIGKISLLTPEQEVELSRRIQTWDQRALEELVEANLRFVVSVAKQYQWAGLSLSDLINEGNVWLITWAKRYDATKWFKFISYAVRRIRQAILSAIADQSRVVRLPLNKVWLLSKINNSRNELTHLLDREPSNEEIADNMNVRYNHVEEVIWLSWLHISLDAHIDEGEPEKGSLLDLIPNAVHDAPSKSLEIEQSLNIDIVTVLRSLSERERDIIKYYFWFHGRIYSLDEIAEIFDITRERARQIKDKALLKLRRTGRSAILRKYLAS